MREDRRGQDDSHQYEIQGQEANNTVEQPLHEEVQEEEYNDNIPEPAEVPNPLALRVHPSTIPRLETGPMIDSILRVNETFHTWADGLNDQEEETYWRDRLTTVHYVLKGLPDKYHWNVIRNWHKNLIHPTTGKTKP